MKTGKRIVSVFLVVLMLLTAAPLAGFVGLEVAPKAKALSTTGQCGENVYWRFNSSTGTLTISGAGAMYNYNRPSVSPFSPYPNNVAIKSVRIESGVTSIGDLAFCDCFEMTSVTIPDSVTSIGDNAFEGCSKLTSVTIPDSVTSIGKEAFNFCSIIKYIVAIGNPSYSTDEFGCLYNIDKTVLIKYPIGAVREDFVIPNSVTSIGEYAFFHGRLTSVTIPDSVTSIGDFAFCYCTSLTSVTIPESVTSIGDYAFSNCSGLTSITIPNSVTSIGDNAFYSCRSLTNVTIPDSVTSIGALAFSFCNNLIGFIISDGNTAYSVDEFGCLYNKDKTVLIQYPIGNIRDAFVIPNSVTDIGEKAFCSCRSLTNVTIPNSVTNISQYAFYYCENLMSAPIPDRVTNIGSSAFSSCKSLTSVTIPANVTSIGNGAFNSCSSLTSITVDTENQAYTSDESGCLFDKSMTKLIHYPAGSRLVFYTVPNSVTSIVSYAFAYCENLNSITLGDNVRNIDNDAFVHCSSLTSIAIPAGVAKIGDRTFEYCVSLTKVAFPLSMTHIGQSAFLGCSSLKDVYYAGGQAQWNIISIDNNNNGSLKNATIHFNSSMPAEEPYTDWSVPVDIVVNNLGMTIPCTYQDAFFAKSSYTYNHKMAIASVALATAGMVSSKEHKKGVFNNPERDPLPEDDGSPDYEKRKAEIESQFRAKEFFEAAGFENYKPVNYKNKPTENSIACVIANKNIDEIQSTVIAVSIRGGGYDAEWGGNFNVGTGQEHEGFSIAADKVFSYLDEFLAVNANDIKYKNNVKYWITGYSRSAAVGNLVAAKLTSGQIPVSNNLYSNVETFFPKAVYAYLFEPPKPTKDDYAKDNAYNNIFNIINREDPVPRVAPGEWGYKRYGKDCYLPSRETTSGEDYQVLFNKMKERFKTVAGEDYNLYFSSDESIENDAPNFHDFIFYEAQGVLGFILSPGDTDLLGWRENHSYSQGLFYDNLIHCIARGMKSASNYTETYQRAITKLLVLSESAGELDTSLKERFRRAINTYLYDISLLENVSLAVLLKVIDAPSWLSKYVLPDFLKDTVVNILYDVLKSEGVTRETIEDTVSTALKGLLPQLGLHYNLTFSALKNICNLVSAHYTQTTASWLLALDGVYEDENEAISKLLSHESTYRVATINCPVSVLVWDKSGLSRAHIVYDYVSDCSNPLSTFIDEDGQKCIILPNDDSYYFQFLGYDEGQMTVSFSTYDFETGERLESVNYYDIPIHKNTDIRATLSPKSETGIFDDIRVYDKVAQIQLIEPSEVISNGEDNSFSVAVESNNAICSVVGGGVYYKGEFSRVAALAAPKYIFDGWYVDNTLVSLDTSYRFRVETDVTLTAHFSACEHQYKDTIVVAPTCTKEGEKTWNCSICDYTYIETVPALGHTDDNNDGHCDRCGEQMTGGDHCKFCGKIHNGGFFDKLTGFFHKIFAIFKR